MRNRSVLIVVFVLVLASLAAGRLLRADGEPGERRRRAECREILRALEEALERYRTDHGAYPPDDRRADPPKALVVYLDGDPGNGGPALAYYEFEPHRTMGLTYLDPWGDPYRYDELASEGLASPGEPGSRPPARVRIRSFDLWSTAGRPDARRGEGWITNYERPEDAAEASAETRPLAEILADLVRRHESLASALETIDTADSARAAAPGIREASGRIADVETELSERGPVSADERQGVQGDLETLESLAGRIDRSASRIWADVREAWDVVREAAADHGPIPTLDRALRNRCKARLRAIGVSLQLWRDFRDQSEIPFGNPGLFRALAEDGLLEDPGAFLCPDSGTRSEAGAFRTEYSTWSAGKLAPGMDAAALPIAWDDVPGRHGGRRNVLFLDGHVWEVSEEEFQALMARWEREGLQD